MAEIQRHIEGCLGLVMSLEAGAPNETNAWIRLEHVKNHQGRWGNPWDKLVQITPLGS